MNAAVMGLNRNWFKDPRMKLLTGPVFIMLVMAMLMVAKPRPVACLYQTRSAACSDMLTSTTSGYSRSGCTVTTCWTPPIRPADPWRGCATPRS